MRRSPISYLVPAIVAAGLLASFSGISWGFWVAFGAIFLSGLVPAHRAVKKKLVPDTTGAEQRSVPVDAAGIPESAKTKDLAKGMGLGG